MYHATTLQGFVSEAKPTPSRKVDLPVDQKPTGLCEEEPGSPLRREVNEDVNLPMPPTPPRHHATPPPPQNPIRAIRVIRGQPNAAITRPVTVGMAITAPALIAERDVSYVMDCVREGRFEGKDLKALIVTIRSLAERQAGIAAGMKKSLPWFSGSTFHRRRGNEFFKAAWFMVFDLDHVPDIEDLKHQAVEKLPFLRYAFQSVRDGVKLVAEFASPITKEDDFRTIWKYLALRVEKALAVKVDSTPDPARACFLSYDPELLTNPSCRPLDPKKTLREAEAIADLLRIFRPAPPVIPAQAGIQNHHRPAPPCHSGVGASAPGAQESRRSHQNNFTSKSGSAQTQSGSTPSEDYSREAWIPGPLPRNDRAAVPSGETARDGVTPLPRDDGADGSSDQHPPIRGIRVIRGQNPDDYEKASKVVLKLAQRQIPYSDWYRIGLALYAGFGEAGRPLWDLFLANPHYRDTQRELDAKWNSFRGVREITLATLFEIGGRHGCQ
ncbi:MAG: PriCT-2 domain-containing protein [Candidatus Cloacimonetes bacterium]|nr:PriCT-2 domain-containing protein [Candidatus Cloacimonadota bacterium]MDY0366978.1 BT4734/BF3469 family protein [Candidatus Syntrophosphaera sp.]